MTSTCFDFFQLLQDTYSYYSYFNFKCQDLYPFRKDRSETGQKQPEVLAPEAKITHFTTSHIAHINHITRITSTSTRTNPINTHRRSRRAEKYENYDAKPVKDHRRPTKNTRITTNNEHRRSCRAKRAKKYENYFENPVKGSRNVRCPCFASDPSALHAIVVLAWFICWCCLTLRCGSLPWWS